MGQTKVVILCGYLGQSDVGVRVRGVEGLHQPIFRKYQCSVVCGKVGEKSQKFIFPGVCEP